MKYRAYFLEFLTPVHFADNNFGGDLEKASFYCSADTYFSAICSEANLISKEILQSIMEKFEQRKLAISSLFPYYYSAPMMIYNYFCQRYIYLWIICRR